MRKGGGVGGEREREMLTSAWMQIDKTWVKSYFTTRSKIKDLANEPRKQYKV